ncbi:MAG: GNAT family N-acetyltransferase [Patescibacteria group bacterium]|nr:GNAT family N-acetyltransferase [Patescibacteria group bacterium]
MSSSFIIELFDKKTHEIKDFTCGVKELDRYLKEKAGQDIKKSVSAVYILRENGSNKVLGYFTLSSYSIVLTDLPSSITKRLPKYPSIPTTLLGRLAVDSSFQGKGLGEYLLMDALKRSYDLSRKIGSFAVIVDAKNKENRSFYERFGFNPFKNKSVTLYLPMNTIKELIS